MASGRRPERAAHRRSPAWVASARSARLRPTSGIRCATAAAASGPITNTPPARPEGRHRRGDQAASRTRHRPAAAGDDGPVQPAGGDRGGRSHRPRPASSSTKATPSRIGAVIGAGICGWEAIEESYRATLLEGRKRVDIFAVPRVMPGAPADRSACSTACADPFFGVTSACSTGQPRLRLGDGPVAARPRRHDAGWRHRRAGHLGRAEGLGGAAGAGARHLSALLRDRDGLVIGEGSGVVVMETLEHAQARGATILAEFAGVGMTADASDIRRADRGGADRRDEGVSCRCRASRPRTSTTSMPMAPAPRPMTRSRRRPSAACSAPMPIGFRCRRPNPCMATRSAPPARWR